MTRRMPLPFSPVPGNWSLRRDLQHRVPVHAGSSPPPLLRSGARRGQVQRLARVRLDLRRIDQPVAAHPHAVVRLGQVGNDVAALVIGDDDLGELGRQVGGLGDHPDAGFGPFRAGHHAADVRRADLLRERGSGEKEKKANEVASRMSGPPPRRLRRIYSGRPAFASPAAVFLLRCARHAAERGRARHPRRKARPGAPARARAPGQGRRVLRRGGLRRRHPGPCHGRHREPGRGRRALAGRPRRGEGRPPPRAHPDDHRPARHRLRQGARSSARPRRCSRWKSAPSPPSSSSA